MISRVIVIEIIYNDGGLVWREEVSITHHHHSVVHYYVKILSSK